MAKVPKTRNHKTMTEAAFWGTVRSNIRKLSMYWKPGEAYLRSVRKLKIEVDPDLFRGKVAITIGDQKDRSTYVYQCEHCFYWFRRDDVDKDHIIPCGKLNCEEDLPGFYKRTFIEIDQGWQCLCKECHTIKSNQEK